MSNEEARAMIKPIDEDTSSQSNQAIDQTVQQETMRKEAKLNVLDKEKKQLLKKLNHIQRSHTWKLSRPLRILQKVFNTLLGRKKIIDQESYIDTLEEILKQTQNELSETKQQLRTLRLQDRLLNSYQTIDFVRQLHDQGELIDFLEQAIDDKKKLNENYRQALIYSARLFMNEPIEKQHLIYKKILAALSIEEIPEFMLRAGLTTDNQLPLREVSSFRANLSMRLRQKQFIDDLPEFLLENKLDAYHFVEQLNVRKPMVIEQKFSLRNLPQKEQVVIKPYEGAGARGVYLVYGFDDIIDINRSKQLTSFTDLQAHMSKDIQTGRVDEDVWIMEELILEDKEKKMPARDIKFYCFYGTVGVILEISRYPERKHCWWTATGERIRTGKYDEQLFKGQGVTKEEIALAEKLSAKIPAPFIRIDFLRSEKGLVFGEFTAKPGNYDEFDEATDQWLGDYYLDAQARLVDDLLHGKTFTEFMRFKESLGYSVEVIK